MKFCNDDTKIIKSKYNTILSINLLFKLAKNNKSFRKVLKSVKDKISTLEEFRQWVKIQLVKKNISQNELARKMKIPQARISEATHGKPSGDKYLRFIIQELDGDLNDFKEFLKIIEKL